MDLSHLAWVRQPIQKQYPQSGGFYRTQVSNIGSLEASGWEIGVDASLIRNSNYTVDLYVVFPT